MSNKLKTKIILLSQKFRNIIFINFQVFIQILNKSTNKSLIFLIFVYLLKILIKFIKSKISKKKKTDLNQHRK
jgi:hypothetical protein